MHASDQGMHPLKASPDRGAGGRLKRPPDHTCHSECFPVEWNWKPICGVESMPQILLVEAKPTKLGAIGKEGEGSADNLAGIYSLK